MRTSGARGFAFEELQIFNDGRENARESVAVSGSGSYSSAAVRCSGCVKGIRGV